MRKQSIYMSQCVTHLTPLERLQIARKSIMICGSLGLTGRVFVTGNDALNVTEGPPQLVDDYFKAMKADERTVSCILHSEKEITAPEFNEYSVWGDFVKTYELPENVYRLTRANLSSALPADATRRMRFFFDALVKPLIIATDTNPD